MTKTSNDSTTSKHPSHRVYAVIKKGERNFWREIGAAWEHGDGNGFGVKLDYLPLNGAEIVIRKPKAEAEASDAEAAYADEAVDRAIAKKKEM